MVIKNETKFTNDCVEGAMRAANFDNNKYKMFKMIYNIFGLIFGMLFVRYMVFQVMGSDKADSFMIVFYGILTALFLYIGMVAMDRNNKKKYHNIYGKMVGITFYYEVDAEKIVVHDEEQDSDTFMWEQVNRWAQDADNIYIFVGQDDSLVFSKKGFIEGTEEDLRQLAQAVIGLREESTKEV